MKQVIIINRELKMRRGKEIAAGCHASIGAYEEANDDHKMAWAIGSANKKVCLQVDSKEKLVELFANAHMMGLPCHIVKDAGKTEVEPGSYTAMAIGPADDELIDKITGELKLY